MVHRILSVSSLVILLSISIGSFSSATAEEAAPPAEPTAEPAAVSAPLEPKPLIEGKYEEIETILADAKDDESAKTAIKALMDTFVDYEELAKVAFKKHFDKLTDAQRATFVEQFKLLIQKTYSRRFSAKKTFSVEMKGKTEFKKEKTLARVKTVVKSGESEADVSYYLIKKDQGWKVYDISVDGTRLARNYRTSFYKVMEKDGFDVLIDKIKAKTDKANDEGDDANQL